jgi:hypothetical protein
VCRLAQPKCKQRLKAAQTIHQATTAPNAKIAMIVVDKFIFVSKD